MKFFHAAASQRKENNVIFSTLDKKSGQIIKENSKIKRVGVTFFKDLLDPMHKEDLCEDQLATFLNDVPTIISE